MSTPEEYFTGKKPNVSHLNIFVSSVYVHVTKNIRQKLESTVEFGTFLGYTETPHNYRVYFPNSRMTVVRHDIKFNEGKTMHLLLERELELHAEEELLVPKMSLYMWINHRRRFMEWRSPLTQSQTSKLAEIIP